MGPFEVAVAGLLVGIPGIIGFTALIMRFHLKKKELERRGSDPELGELRDDLNDTRAQLADMQERLDFAERFAHRRACVARGQKWVTVSLAGLGGKPAPSVPAAFGALAV